MLEDGSAYVKMANVYNLKCSENEVAKRLARTLTYCEQEQNYRKLNCSKTCKY